LKLWRCAPLGRAAAVNVQAMCWISRTTQAEENRNVCFRSETDSGVCKKISQVEVRLKSRRKTGKRRTAPLFSLSAVPLARFHGFGRIYRRIADLLVDIVPDLSMRNVARRADSIGIPSISSLSVNRTCALLGLPVAEDRKGDSVLLSEGKIRKRAVHTHTQNLGVGASSFTRFCWKAFISWVSPR